MGLKISKLIIRDYQQFQDFEVDLTYPEGHPKAGQPLEKVCLIGRNGTGKTKVLEVIKSIIMTQPILKGSAFCKIEFEGISRYWGFINLPNKGQIRGLFNLEIEKYYSEIISKTINLNNIQSIIFPKQEISSKFTNHLFIETLAQFIYSPAESSQNPLIEISDVPVTNLGNALELKSSDTPYEIVSPETIEKFWRRLILSIHLRKENYLKFQEEIQNLNRTISEVRTEFDQKNPKILERLGEVWNHILEKANLYFDVEGAVGPTTPNDNLKAYIKLLKTNETIPYSGLSTGIRNFIFRIGHIFSLFFNRPVKNSILLLDEPENSLHPDFLYDLVSYYRQACNPDTQIFMATHSPIIAAQFDPAERILLEFNEEDGTVYAKKGVSPEGDDPNDLLRNDFEVRNLYGEVGLAKWERYKELKFKISKESDPIKKAPMVDEFLEIGRLYKFPFNEVS